MSKPGEKEDRSTSRSKLVLVITIFVIGGLVASYFIFPSYQAFISEAFQVLTSDNEKRISNWVSDFGMWGPVFIIAAIVGQMFLVVVNVVLLMLVAILAYGSFWGSIIAITGICVASTVGYYIGSALGEFTVYQLIGKKAKEQTEKYTQKYGYAAVVAARLSPFLSNDAISFVAGLLKMNYWKFMVATLAGIIPLTVLIAWLSENMQRLRAGIIWITVISIVAFLLYVIYKRFLKP